MSTVSPAVPAPRIVMFGIECAFTRRVIDDLSERGLPPLALMLPGHPGIEQPLRVSPPATSLPLVGAVARREPYRTYRLGRLDTTAVSDFIASLQPDYIVVACFPRLIPRAIRDLSRIMSLNVHPSLLPQHRGPDPLFWIMRDGGAGCGVTVHELSGQYDAGPVVAQRAVPYPDGSRETAVEDLLAGAGASLVGEIIESAEPVTIDIDPRAASYETWPRDEDYAVDTTIPVKRAWNFVRGVAERGVPVRIDGPTGSLYVTDAVAFGYGADPPNLVGPGKLVCRFRGGWLIAITDGSTRH